jgi:hypothetical protein
MMRELINPKKNDDDLKKIENGVSQMMQMMIQDYVLLQNAFNSLYLILEKKGLVSEKEMHEMAKKLIAQENNEVENGGK